MVVYGAFLSADLQGMVVYEAFLSADLQGMVVYEAFLSADLQGMVVYEAFLSADLQSMVVYEAFLSADLQGMVVYKGIPVNRDIRYSSIQNIRIIWFTNYGSGTFWIVRGTRFDSIQANITSNPYLLSRPIDVYF